MRHTGGFLLVALGLFAAAIPALAHHSITAEFDPGKEISVTGVLTRVDWTNPHIYWYVDAKDESGQVETWSFEGNPPSTLHRAGVKKEDWKIGETVTVTAAAAKDGTKHFGFGKMIKYSDGHVLVFRVGGE
jgi:hypothetical protein